jgi:hypothetical protein
MLKSGALILVAAFAATALIPSLAASQQAPENPAATHEQKTDSTQRGTEAAPVVVKLMNTGQSDAVAAENRKQEDQKASFEREATNWSMAAFIGDPKLS